MQYLGGMQEQDRSRESLILFLGVLEVKKPQGDIFPPTTLLTEASISMAESSSCFKKPEDFQHPRVLYTLKVAMH
jgi:hypothetical protein